METAEILEIISIASFALAAASAIAAVILFIYFRIPAVVGDLSGRAAKKSITRMRQGNEKSGEKSFRPSMVNKERGPITDSADVSEIEHDLSNRIYYEGSDIPQTGLLREEAAKPAPETAAETSVLSSEETGILEEETGLPGQKEICPGSGTAMSSARENGSALEMIDEVILIHTDEVI